MQVISAFHDLGLTSDDPVDASVKTLRDLTVWRMSKRPEHSLNDQQRNLLAKMTTGMPQKDIDLTYGVIKRVDFSYLNGNAKLIEDAMVQIVKSMRFLGFFDDANNLTTKSAEGKARSCLDSFGDVMATRMQHTHHDRDLVVMRHNFLIENQKKERWEHTSTWIESGMSHASGGFSLMSKSVGVTAAIGARLVLEGKIGMKGVVTPMHAEIYEPILKILEERFGISMIEESERPDGLPTTVRKAKL